MHAKRRFISTNPWRRTSKSKVKKTDEYKSGKQSYVGANKEQNTENLTSPENDIRWRKQGAKIGKAWRVQVQKTTLWRR